MKFYSLFL